MLHLALRHLLARKRQTIMTLLGIVFGASAYIVIASFFTGFQTFIIDQLINNDAHVRISAREEFLEEHQLDTTFFSKLNHVFWHSPPSGRRDNARIEDPEGWFKRLRADPRVKAYSPQLIAQVIVSRASATISVRLIGSDPVRQELVTNLRHYMVNGKFSDVGLGGNRMVVGVEMLQRIGARVGETVLVSTGRSAPIPFKITGSFKIGIRALDEGTAFGALSDVQKINGTPSQVNEIAVRLMDVEGARNLAADWAKLSRERVQSWDQINANFLSVVKIQNAMRYLMTATILIVAGFGIYNILNMVVSQKRKDIAILRSMGFEGFEIIFLFLFQGVVLGVIGGIIGMVIAFGVCLYLQTIPFAGGPLGSGTGYLTIVFDPAIYVGGIVLAVLASSIASFLPARSAGKLTPIEIIRGGTE